MADYLVYWKGFWEDRGEDGGSSLDDWWSRDEDLYEGVGYGDTLWVVVSGGAQAPTEWRLLAAVRVARKSMPARSHAKYGGYHFVGDGRQSRGFELAAQPDLAGVLRLVRFASGRRITRVGRSIGQLLQKPRRLAAADTVLLSEYASTFHDGAPAT